ncbi:GNAT family N-acetyltransferase [soil metagenome]
MKKLNFRKLTGEDFPLLLEWLSRKHVREFWDSGEDTLEIVAQNYAEEEGVERFILLEETDGGEKPLGYFQYYIVSKHTIGIDQFIGEEDYINRGIGTKAIMQFIGMISKKNSPKEIILDPSPENKRAIRCYEKVGFRHYETTIGYEGKPAYMMRLVLS